MPVDKLLAAEGALGVMYGLQIGLAPAKSAEAFYGDKAPSKVRDLSLWETSIQFRKRLSTKSTCGVSEAAPKDVSSLSFLPLIPRITAGSPQATTGVAKFLGVSNIAWVRSDPSHRVDK